MSQVNTHHRKPRSIGGTDAKRNLSEIKKDLHDAWHHLFSNWDANRIAAEINQFFLDPDYEFIVRKKGTT